jgi:glycosidase
MPASSLATHALSSSPADRPGLAARLRALGLGLLVALSVLAGCGDYSVYSQTPIDPFDPGPRREGSGYGSGSGSGGMVTPSPMCMPAERRCDREFVYRGTAMMPSTGDEQAVELRGDYASDGWTKGRAMTFDGKQWHLTVPVPWEGKVLYKFRIVDKAGKESWIPDPDNPTTEPDNFGGQNSVLVTGTCGRWTCAEPVPMCTASAPAGSFDWRDAVLYFAFVDRFLDGNPGNNAPWTLGGVDGSANWQGGDWAGLTQRIKDGYFDQLGVNALWVTVPMDNTDGIGVGDDGRNYTGYHGYWPRDLSKPERRFGTEAELVTLVSEAHKRGIKVLVDYAMNHVHKDSPVYTMHKDWFNPLDKGGGQCVCGSAVCPWDGPTATVCWFRDYLPDFNFQNALARDFSVSNAIEWVKKYQLDGLRLDAVKHIEVSWLTDLRDRLTKEVETTTKQHVYLVGETYTGDRALIKSFIDPCKKLDGQFDFPLRAELGTKILLRQGKMQDLEGFMNSNVDFYGTGLNSTFIGNHDVPRSIHFAQDTPLWSDIWTGGKDRNFTGKPGTVAETSAYERLALAMAVLMTNRGVPLIYYGDEIGLSGAGDPDNRRFMDWNSAGYNTGQKLLLDRHKKLGQLRKAHPALRRGTRTTLSLADDTWAYSMVEGSDTVYVLLNRSDADKTVGGLPAGSYTDQITATTVTGPSVSVPARSFRILTK